MFLLHGHVSLDRMFYSAHFCGVAWPVTPDQPRDSQTTPGTVRPTQAQSDPPRDSQNHPRDSQTHPRDSQTHPGTVRPPPGQADHPRFWELLLCVLQHVLGVLTHPNIVLPLTLYFLSRSSMMFNCVCKTYSCPDSWCIFFISFSFFFLHQQMQTKIYLCLCLLSNYFKNISFWFKSEYNYSGT